MININLKNAEKYRPVIPYGKWTQLNGDQVLFNRGYAPFAVKKPSGEVEICDHFWVKNIVNSEHFWDDWEPPWKSPEILQKCCQILDDWGVVISPRFERGAVSHIVYRHDDWCTQLNGKSACNCEPDIEFDANPETIYDGGAAR